MTLKERIESFSELGKILRDYLDGKITAYGSALEKLIKTQHFHNPWFTPDNMRLAIGSIADILTYDNLIRWTGNYPELSSAKTSDNVGVIMAGNIPLVGFHDFISVLITGNRIISKISSKDSESIVLLSDILCEINPSFTGKINFTSDFLKGYDIVIATGGDNSSRYFEYYFRNYPRIIRRNRNSIAVIDGKESPEELEALGADVFSYFGLGCRNVSKIYLPEGYDLTMLTENWKSFSSLINHTKYANNYDFNKAVALVNNEKFSDTGYLILKENNGLASPVAMLYYEFYNSPEKVIENIRLLKEKIQCVIGRNHVYFGKSQQPELWDYADGLDTVDFLLKKNDPRIM
jgi:hypothetical protein